MTGSLADVARLSVVALALLAACAEEPPSAPRDGGVIRDGGVARDAGVIEDSDAGTADAGPSRRTMQQEDWLPPEDVQNYMLASNLDLEMFNLGWQSGGVEGGLAPLIRRVESGLPGFRREWAEIPSRFDQPGGSYIIGFGKAPDGPIAVSLWVAQTDTATAPGDAVQVGLHGIDVTGEPRALLMTPDDTPPRVIGKWRWRRWTAHDPEAWTGFVTMLVINASATPVGITSPRVGPSHAFARHGRRASATGIPRAPNRVERDLIARAIQRSRVAPEVPLDSWGLPDHSLLVRLRGGSSPAQRPVLRP